MSFVDAAGRRAFTGDALLIRACGRTDFQQGIIKFDCQYLFLILFLCQ